MVEECVDYIHMWCAGSMYEGYWWVFYIAHGINSKPISAWNITLCLLVKPGQTVGFERTGYTVLEGESVEVCITVMPGSSPNQETFNLFTQPSANTGEIESHVSSESAKLPFIPISPSHTHTHTHTHHTHNIYTHTRTLKPWKSPTTAYRKAV